jgi:hypothetical protein
VAVAAMLMRPLRQKPCQARRMLKPMKANIQSSRWYAAPVSSRTIRPFSRATTRLRTAVTTSALWVAIRTVTPSSLMRSSSWMISQLMSGSRLPVGSSAMKRRGLWTRARAIAVLCCSPPESWLGSWSAWPVRPDDSQDAVHGRCDRLSLGAP